MLSSAAQLLKLHVERSLLLMVSPSRAGMWTWPKSGYLVVACYDSADANPSAYRGVISITLESKARYQLLAELVAVVAPIPITLQRHLDSLDKLYQMLLQTLQDGPGFGYLQGTQIHPSEILTLASAMIEFLEAGPFEDISMVTISSAWRGCLYHLCSCRS